MVSFFHRAILGLSILLAAPQIAADTTIQFGKPTRTSSQSSAVTVPNNFIINEINDFVAELLQDIKTVAMTRMGGLTISAISADFPAPTLQLTGTGNTVKVTVSGLNKVILKASFRNTLTVLACFGSARGDITIKDLSVSAIYDYFTGSIRDFKPTFSDIDVDLSCSFPTPGFFLAPVLEFLGFLDMEAMARKIINEESASLNGRFENVLSVRDALAGAEESGLREIRQTVEGALMILGGVKSAVACFIASFITEEMIRRLALQTAVPQIDQLRRLLSGLPDFIANQLPEIPDFINGNLVGSSLQDFLLANLPNIQMFLLGQLNSAFDVGVDLVRDIEIAAIQALCAIVKVDFTRLISGVNVRLVVNLSANFVVFDAFHTEPASFIGKAEATIPCNPTYTIPAVENAVEYIAYNSNGRVVYSSTFPTSDLMVQGLLTAAQVKGPWGLYSYGRAAKIVLINFADCGGCTSDNFRWPRCEVGGEPAVAPPPVPAPRAVPVARPVRLPPGVNCP